MILPTTYWAALLLAVLSMILWGSWANTFKSSAGKWRFELFYFDFAFGMVVAASLAAITLGQFGMELSFIDNLVVTGKRQIGYAMLAGGVFNLANMLLLAAISLSGMAVVFPIAVGLGLVISVMFSLFLNPQGNPVFLFGGVALVALAMVFDALAFHTYSRAQAQLTGRKARPSAKVVVVSLISGALMGLFHPLIELSQSGDIGLGPYAVAFAFSVGVFFSTFILNIYFMNLPVHGKAIEFAQYFKGTARQHVSGVLGGVLWCAGFIASLLSASAPKAVQAAPAAGIGLAQGATVIGVLWGLFYWKEFQGADGKVNTLVRMMLLFLIAGLTLISVAPMFHS
ncbi:MAG TPA: hypothetical protein VM120_14375 [Bryobacteraceae bacterium]|nr:hypothetical protein [Bryobacteraceae bacterium]